MLNGQMTRGCFLRLGGLAAAGMVLGGRSEGAEGAVVPERGDSVDNLLANGGGGPVAGGFLMRGARGTKRVALTFDDGPAPKTTGTVLKTLDRFKIKSTFFMIGKSVVESPGMAREVHAAGHELANHSFTHPSLGSLSQGRVEQELRLCQDAIQKHVGVNAAWLRPPYGSFRTSQASIARNEKLNVVIWSVDPQDWRRPGVATIQRRILEGTAGGDIILCHDIHAQTVEALPGVIEGLLERGFEPVTLSQLVLG